MSKKVTTDIVSVSGFKNILNHKAWVKLGVFVLVGMGIQAAQACPIKNTITSLQRVNMTTDVDGETIYFCKQGFTDLQLYFAPSETAVYTEGSRVISTGDTTSIQNFPVTGSVNLAGFTPSQLNLNKLNYKFPNSGGRYDKQSLFNFYTRVDYAANSCYNYSDVNQFDNIKAYLRANANIFQANGGAQTGEGLNLGNELAIIRDVPMSNVNHTGSKIIADITFYHSNPTTGQWFSNKDDDSRMCWVGINTRVDIKMDGNNSNGVKHSGDYIVDVGVATN